MFMDFPMIPMGLKPVHFPFFTTPLTNWNGLNDWNAVRPISTEPILIHFPIPTAVQAAYGAFSASGDMNRWILLVIGLRTYGQTLLIGFLVKATKKSKHIMCLVFI